MVIYGREINLCTDSVIFLVIIKDDVDTLFVFFKFIFVIIIVIIIFVVLVVIVDKNDKR